MRPWVCAHLLPYSVFARAEQGSRPCDRVGGRNLHCCRLENDGTLHMNTATTRFPVSKLSLALSDILVIRLPVTDTLHIQTETRIRTRGNPIHLYIIYHYIYTWTYIYVYIYIYICIYVIYIYYMCIHTCNIATYRHIHIYRHRHRHIQYMFIYTYTRTQFTAVCYDS